MRDAVRNKEGWKRRLRLPKLLVLTCGVVWMKTRRREAGDQIAVVRAATGCGELGISHGGVIGGSNKGKATSRAGDPGTNGDVLSIQNIRRAGDLRREHSDRVDRAVPNADSRDVLAGTLVAWAPTLGALSVFRPRKKHVLVLSINMGCADTVHFQSKPNTPFRLGQSRTLRTRFYPPKFWSPGVVWKTGGTAEVTWQVLNK